MHLTVRYHCNLHSAGECPKFVKLLAAYDSAENINHR